MYKLYREKATYTTTLMIIKPHSEPSTMMAAMLKKAKALPEETSQDFVLFTVYQHLYRVAVHILWYNKECIF